MQKVGIVIPCYNEARRLSGKFFMDFLDTTEFVNLCFVNDGSKDDTISVLRSIQTKYNDRVFVIDLKKNVGKAEAVRNGITNMLSQRQYNFVGYFDADLSTPLSEIEYFFLFQKFKPECLAMLGSRVKRMGTRINRKFFRHYIGRIFSTVASMILKMPVYDTQCGAKIFATDLADEIFNAPFISSWLFDLELLARISEKKGLEEAKKIILEIPLNEWTHKSGSKIKSFDILRIFLELTKISWYYRNKY
jgi:glycosyltransferase involved in cell wall biosynthesis